MRTIAMIALASIATAFVTVPAAHAAPAYRGGCFLYATNDPSGQVLNPDTFTGVLYAAVAGADDSGGGNPAAVSVTCALTVNGAVADVASFAGSGLAGGAEDTSYVAHERDLVEVCTRVIVNRRDFAEICAAVRSVSVPPDEVRQILGSLGACDVWDFICWLKWWTIFGLGPIAID